MKRFTKKLRQIVVHLATIVVCLGVGKENQYKFNDDIQIMAEEPLNALQYIQYSRSGIPASLAYSISNAFKLSLQELAELLHITPRTIQRKKEGYLLPVPVSEHLLELHRLFQKGLEVFGDRERFQLWLACKVISLGNKRPVEFLDTTFGIQLLYDELSRLQYGVFS